MITREEEKKVPAEERARIMAEIKAGNTAKLLRESNEELQTQLKNISNLAREQIKTIEQLSKENDDLTLKLGHVSGLYRKSLFDLSNLKNQYSQINETRIKQRDDIIKLSEQLIERNEEVRSSLMDSQKSSLKLKEKEDELKRAEKMSAKAYNLKMNNRTLNDKVCKLQAEIDSMKECQLCFEPYDNQNRKPAVTNCVHIFCKECLKKHTKSNTGCPMCRQRYAVHDIRELHLHFV